MTEPELTEKELEIAAIADELTLLRARKAGVEREITWAQERLESVQREATAAMPKKFVEAYMDLVARGIGIYGKEDLSISGTPSGGGKHGKSVHSGGLKDEAAVDFRQKIDRELRVVGRRITAWCGTKDGEERLRLSRPVKCVRCAKYLEHGWQYCPYCGGDQSEGPQGKYRS